MSEQSGGSGQAWGRREAVNADDNCASLVRSGLEDCWDNYNRVKRAGYLDELSARLFGGNSVGLVLE